MFEPLCIPLESNEEQLGPWHDIALNQPFGYEWVAEGWAIVLHDTFRIWSAENGWLRTGRFLYPWAWSETANAFIWWKSATAISPGSDWATHGNYYFGWSE